MEGLVLCLPTVPFSGHIFIKGLPISVLLPMEALIVLSVKVLTAFAVALMLTRGLFGFGLSNVFCPMEEHLNVYGSFLCNSFSDRKSTDYAKIHYPKFTLNEWLYYEGKKSSF